MGFDTTFQEHESTITISYFRIANKNVFQYTKLFFYNLLVIFFGFLFSLLWGFIASILLFVITWIWNPVLKMNLLILGATVPIVTEPLKAFFTPLSDVSARIFRQIHVKANIDGKLLSPLSTTRDAGHMA